MREREFKRSKTWRKEQSQQECGIASALHEASSVTQPDFLP
jgi:hypothetical protein